MDNYIITVINSHNDFDTVTSATYGMLQTPLFNVTVDHIQTRYNDHLFER